MIEDPLTEYLTSRGSEPDVATKVVLDVLGRQLQQSGAIRVSLVGWLYRLLRNAIVDRGPRELAKSLRMDTTDAELRGAVCAVVTFAATFLPAEQADVLLAIDVDLYSAERFATDRALPLSVVKDRVAAAREALRQRIVSEVLTTARP